MRVKWANGKPSGAPEKVVDLPSSTPSVHVSRTINFGPDGRLYVAIGSRATSVWKPIPAGRRFRCSTPTARSSRTRADCTTRSASTGIRKRAACGPRHRAGQSRRRFSAGRNRSDRRREALRLSLFHRPESSERRTAGAQRRDGRRDVEAAVPPVLELPAHSHRYGLRFYRGTQFPAPYRGALFLAMHGSSRKNNGYKVVRVVMKDGRPTGLEDFATGWLKDGVVMGRPAGLATGSRRCALRVGRQQGVHLPSPCARATSSSSPVNR